MKKGMLVDVYRSKHDCTNNGFSSKSDTLLLVGADVPEIFDAGDYPVVELCSRVIAGQEYLYVKPVGLLGWQVGWFMFGGNFIYSSDSRFPSNQPIAIHDRLEA